MTALTDIDNTYDKSSVSRYQQKKALEDFTGAIQKSPIWFMMAWQDIQLRYRRSVIGPFWITLSMAIMVYTMGFLYAHLWKVPLQGYFPYLAAGLLAWGLISSLLVESTDTYLVSVGLIKQIKMPYFLHIHRMCTRNFIIFAHNLLIMLPIYLFFPQQFSMSFAYLMFFVNVMLLYVLAVLYTNVISMVCARYRDLGQIIKSLIQVLFFLTPVMWKIETLPAHIQKWMMLNPFYHLIEMIRQPLMGCYPSTQNLWGITCLLCLGIVFNRLLFVPYRARIVYWI